MVKIYRRGSQERHDDTTSSSFIFLQQTLKLLLGWLANSEELIVADQTVHSYLKIYYTDATITALKKL